MKKKNFIIAILALIIVVGILGYMGYGYYAKKTIKVQNPVVTMSIKDYGEIKIELYPEMAPNTVRNFIKLINEGYYNGLTFHRIEEELIQGGDIQGDGSGETEYTIEGEFAANGFKENTLGFEKGTLGLARQDYSIYYYYTGDTSYLTKGYNTGCAQFFITAEDCSEYFNDYYCAFGKVIEGMDVVDTLKTIETEKEVDEETGEESSTSTPVNPPIIESITVDTFGINYNNPKTVKE